VHEGAAPTTFSVVPTDDGVVLGGEIDIAAADTLRAELAKLTEAPRVVAIDLQAVSFIDSSGIEALCAARRDAHAVGGSVVLRSPSTTVTRVLEVTGLDDLFPIDRSPAAD
jgi:anti-anti-sigma factor